MSECPFLRRKMQQALFIYLFLFYLFLLNLFCLRKKRQVAACMRLFLRRGLTIHDYSFWRNHQHPGATTALGTTNAYGTQDSGELRAQRHGEVEFRRIEAVLRQQLRPQLFEPMPDCM